LSVVLFFVYFQGVGEGCGAGVGVKYLEGTCVNCFLLQLLFLTHTGVAYITKAKKELEQKEAHTTEVKKQKVTTGW